jgi:dolichyl-phosphate beta-glucosyltransferase
MGSAKIIIPCYNEEKRLNLASFNEFTNPSHSISFVFVDDGSTDGTHRLLQSLRTANPNKFAVLKLHRNCGKGEAVRQGFLSAVNSPPDYVGFWDADLATPLDAIPEFLDFAEARPDLEVILGARVKLLGRQVERNCYRHYLGRCFATVVSVVLGLDVYDTQCGAKLFKVSLRTKKLFEQPFHSRWIFDVEILARLINATPQVQDIIYEFPLQQWRDIEGSKVRYTDFAQAAFELLWIRNNYFRKGHE